MNITIKPVGGDSLAFYEAPSFDEFGAAIEGEFVGQAVSLAEASKHGPRAPSSQWLFLDSDGNEIGEASTFEGWKAHVARMVDQVTTRRREASAQLAGSQDANDMALADAKADSRILDAPPMQVVTYERGDYHRILA